ncbi:hypothetical protein [Streptomyces sp. NBC_01306]|nr:hypothetical protein [Streptomyces sp. NBC_01306]MCX4724178.1 hypothetical protein [Streptomyces sp. NBC_01306]
MDASGVIDGTEKEGTEKEGTETAGTETAGADPAEPSVPAPDRIEGGVSGERLVLFTDAVTAISITL